MSEPGQMPTGVVQVFVDGSVHVVRVEPGQRVNVQVTGNLIRALRTDEAESLLQGART